MYFCHALIHIKFGWNIKLTWDGGADDVVQLGVLQGQVPEHGAVGEQELKARPADAGDAQVQVLQSEKRWNWNAMNEEY